MKTAQTDNRPVAVVSRPHALDAPQRDGNGAYGNGKLNVQKLNALNSESAMNAIAKADHPRRPVWTRTADRGSQRHSIRTHARVGAIHAASCMPHRHADYTVADCALCDITSTHSKFERTVSGAYLEPSSIH